MHVCAYRARFTYLMRASRRTVNFTFTSCESQAGNVCRTQRLSYARAQMYQSIRTQSLSLHVSELKSLNHGQIYRLGSLLHFICESPRHCPTSLSIRDRARRARERRLISPPVHRDPCRWDPGLDVIAMTACIHQISGKCDLSLQPPWAVQFSRLGTSTCT